MAKWKPCKRREFIKKQGEDVTSNNNDPIEAQIFELDIF